MISATDRLRLKPCLPVEQKAQSSAQPACVEIHSVPRSSSGMNTVSTALPLPTSIRNLRVPSSDSLSETTAGGATTALTLSFSRKLLAMSVMASKSATPERCIQRNTCRARKGFSPCSANQAVRPSASKSSRLTVIDYILFSWTGRAWREDEPKTVHIARQGEVDKATAGLNMKSN